ncbi:MAG: hypothetical protein QOI66_2693 [Myxococcales bacterium]|nr:hypothetical protein [Myxococcales bacterium]
MKIFAPILLSLSLSLSLSAFSCSQPLITQPVHRAGDDWDITYTKIQKGPDAYHEGNTNYHPVRGEHFYHVVLTLQNRAAVERKFNFDRCDLDLKDEVVVPSLIDAATFINWTVNREPKLSPGETISRRLIYSYPDRYSPTRLACIPMDPVPLPP